MVKSLQEVVAFLSVKYGFNATEALACLKIEKPAAPKPRVKRCCAKKQSCACGRNLNLWKLVMKELLKAKLPKRWAKEKVKAAKLAAKEDAKAAKLAEKVAAKAIVDAAKAEAKAAKLAEKAAAKAIVDAEKAKVKAGKLAEKAAAKEIKTVAKLTEQLAKLFDLEELDDDLKQTVAGKDSVALKELIVTEKAGLKAKKKRETQIRKLAEKRAKLIAEIRDLAKHCGGGINFSENEIEGADMDGLKEIRKTIKKCLRKIERANQKACTAAEVSADAAQFDREMIALPIC